MHQHSAFPHLLSHLGLTYLSSFCSWHHHHFTNKKVWVPGGVRRPWQKWEGGWQSSEWDVEPRFRTAGRPRAGAAAGRGGRKSGTESHLPPPSAPQCPPPRSQPAGSRASPKLVADCLHTHTHGQTHKHSHCLTHILTHSKLWTHKHIHTINTHTAPPHTHTLSHTNQGTRAPRRPQ